MSFHVYLRATTDVNLLRDCHTHLKEKKHNGIGAKTAFGKSDVMEEYF
jgi:hypothetical protein